MRYLKTFESHSEAEELYFYIDDSGKESIVMISKRDDGKWVESVVRGNAPYNFGKKSYMGYLSPSDIHGWLQRDYANVEMIEEEDIDSYLEERPEKTKVELYKFPEEFDNYNGIDYVTLVTPEDKVYDILENGEVKKISDYGDIDEFLQEGREVAIDDLSEELTKAVLESGLL